MNRAGKWSPSFRCIVLSFLLSACGLEQYLLLKPPVAVINVGTQQFQFRATADNSESEFRGFEVYYKIYRQSDSIDLDINTIEDLRSKSFQRMNNDLTDRKDAISKPLIPIAILDRGKEFVVTIDFSGDLSLPSLPQITANDLILTSPFTINDARRGVTYPDAGYLDRFKRFADFEANDQDISSQIWADISAAIDVQLVAYVLSYGRDVINNTDAYSQPVWLGVISRKLPERL